MVSRAQWSRNFLKLPRFLLVFTLVFSLVFVAACNRGPRLVKVDGSVQVDGQPTGGVTLIFFEHESSMAVASARSEENGSFSPSTDMNPGIPEGKYRVAATWPDPKFVAPKTSMGATPPDPPDLLGGRYTMSKSDVVVDVSSSSPKVVVELTTK
jgi:hypothetical protein